MAGRRDHQDRQARSGRMSPNDDSDGGVDISSHGLGDLGQLVRTKSGSSAHSFISQGILLPDLGLDEPMGRLQLTSRDLVATANNRGSSKDLHTDRSITQGHVPTRPWAFDPNATAIGTGAFSQLHTCTNNQISQPIASTSAMSGYPTHNSNPQQHPSSQWRSENVPVQVSMIAHQPSGPVTHHHVSFSIDSGFGQSQSQALAEKVRSGATENIDRLNHGIIGPTLKLVGANNWIVAPARDRHSSKSPKSPMPPLVPGYNGAPRPRFGQVRSQTNISTQSIRPLNIDGPTVAYFGFINDPMPAWFAVAVTGRYRPTVQEVYQAMPFFQPYRRAVAMTAPVIKIQYPPYSTTRSELLSFIGPASQVCMQPPGSPYHAVHIITDRYSGKTMDAYIEIKSQRDAVLTLQHIEKRKQDNKPLKMGNRSCVVTMSSQEELMEELFPRGKFTAWNGAAPKVSSRVPWYYQDMPSTGFDGFMDPEELALMAKYAEIPHRSPFVDRCPIRIYESLISVLHKYPWFAPQHILLRERDALFEVTATSIRALIVLLARTNNSIPPIETNPNPTILRELIVAALTCPGFSESQKAIVVSNAVQSGWGHFTLSRGMNLRFGGTHKFASKWPFKALARMPGSSDPLVNYVASLLKNAVARTNTLSLANIRDMRESRADQLPFCDLKIDYNGARTLADAARIELRHVQELLRVVLPNGHSFIGAGFTFPSSVS